MTHRVPPYTVEYGLGAVHSLAHYLGKRSTTKVLVVCGRRSLIASGAERAIEALERVSTVVRWHEFSPNVSIEDLAAGVSVARDFMPDVIIGIGGGSAMDMAKLLAFAHATVSPSMDLETVVRTSPEPHHPTPQLVLVPTTSGSGSEATHFAVAYIGADKFSVAHRSMYATHVILDPELILSGSPHQRATSGIDAVCQSIESWWARGATDHSRRLARHALSLLTGSIRSFVSSPTTPTARAMLLGAHLAGRAIDISKTTGAHALSYHLTSAYSIDHGNAVALTLGRFIERHSNDSDPALQIVMRGILRAIGAADGVSGRVAFETLVSDIGLVNDLADVVADPAAIAAWVATVNVQRLGNNPVTMSTDDLTSLVSTP